jgi:hypothetical protein
MGGVTQLRSSCYYFVVKTHKRKKMSFATHVAWESDNADKRFRQHSCREMDRDVVRTLIFQWMLKTRWRLLDGFMYMSTGPSGGLV